MPIPGRRTIRFKLLLLIPALLLCPIHAHSWGFTAHKQINYSAVFVLPHPVFAFYKTHIQEITDKAVNADMRRYLMPNEACRHYLDADHYEKKFPVDTIPHNWYEAIAKFSADTLNAYGIAPWNLMQITRQLTHAFEQKDLRRIIRLSADLGHYAGDLNVPLHTTENYNGQRSGQEGIHALWESRLFELNYSGYDVLFPKAAYLENIPELIWKHFSESFAALDSVLYFERIASQAYPDRYVLVKKGNNIQRQYHEAFCSDYHQLLNGMVERQFKKSVWLTASLWYSAWVDAGQPNLNSLTEAEIPAEEQNEQTLLQTLWQKGQILGRKED